MAQYNRMNAPPKFFHQILTS